MRDDYAEAVRLWGQLADQGDARAQFGIGKMYYIGQGVQRDYAQADAWYQKAADQGFDYAQFDLGVAYEDGPWRAAGLWAGPHVVQLGFVGRNQHRPSPNGSRKSR
jgi:TPR repeat protein